MSRQISQHELDAVFKAVSGFPDGASLLQVNEALVIGRSRRTLQRRLVLLVEQQRLIHEGRDPGSRYRLPAIAATAEGAFAG